MKQLNEMFDENELSKYISNSVNEGVVGDFFKKTFNYLKGKIAQVGAYFVALWNDHVLPSTTPVTSQIAWKNGDIDTTGLNMIADKESAKFSHISTNMKDILKTRDGDTLRWWKSMCPACESRMGELGNEINESRIAEMFGEEFDASRIDEELKLAHDSKEIPAADADMLKSLVRTVLHNPNAAPLLIWGAPGVGKTQVVKAVLKEVQGEDANLLDFQLSIKEHDDFFLPSYAVNDKGEKIAAIDLPKSYLPVWKKTKDMSDEECKAADAACGKGLIFLDELTQAKPSVQAVMLKLVNERMLGEDYRLGSGWRIIAAANREQDMVTSQPWNAALGNRFMQVNYEPTVKTWRKWADTKGYMNKHVLDWLEQNEKYFYHAGDLDTVEVPYATPRSWELACRQLAIYAHTAAEEGFDLMDIPDSIIRFQLAACVGMDAALAFMDYVKLARTINIEDLKLVFTNPEKAVLPEKRGSSYKVDILYIITTQIVSLLKNDPTHDEWVNICKYVARLQNESACGNIIRAITSKFPKMNRKFGESGTYDGDNKKYPYYDGLVILVNAYPEYESYDINDLGFK